MNDIQEVVNIGYVRVFPNSEPDKDQAKKVLEESAELYAEWSNWHKAPPNTPNEEESLTHICEEAADLIMATSNLLASLGVHDLGWYMKRCEQKNEEKGRYF